MNLLVSKFCIVSLFFLFTSGSLFGFSVGIITDVNSIQTDAIGKKIIEQSELLIGKDIAIVSYSQDSVEDQYNKFLQDDSVNVIVYLGAEKLTEIFKKNQFKKPVVFPFTSKFLIDLPVKNGMSNISNFSYIEPNLKINDDLLAAINLFGTGTHVVVLSSSFEHKFKSIKTKLDKLIANQNSQVLVISSDEIEASLKSKSVKSVLFGYNCLKRESLKSTLDKVISKGIGTYCVFGAYKVEDGFVAGYDSSSYFNAIVRKTAFAIKDVFESKNLAKTHVNFRTIGIPDLIINVNLARKLKLNLTFDDLFTSKLLNVNKGLKKVSLVEFVAAAQQGALTYQKDKEKLAETSYDYKIAKSYLRPSIDTSLYQDWIDKDQSKVTKYPESKVVLNFGIKQIIYNNDIRLNLESKKFLETAHDYQDQSSRLDTIVNAANVYINTEKAYTVLELSKKNLNISKQNYNIVLLKKQIGSASKSELLRFESEMIKDKSDLSDALSSYRVSLIYLYKFINAGAMQLFRTEPVQIKSIIENPHNQNLFSILSSPFSLERFKGAVNKIAIKHSVDIKQLNAYVSVQDSAVTYARRKLVVPDVSLTGSVNNWLDTSGENKDTLLNSMDEYLMGINLNFSYTLFDTNRRRNQLRKEKSKLIQVKIERQKQVNNVIAKLDVVIEKIRKSYAQYNYQKKLVKLSEENLVLVQDQYSLGRSSILDVIDAQETYFTAETKYMTASYELLKFMYEFNRYNGGFDMFYVNTKSKIDNNLIDDIVNSIDNKLIN